MQSTCFRCYQTYEIGSSHSCPRKTCSSCGTKYDASTVHVCDDRGDWNRKYGYHHTLGPGYGPKYLP